MVSARSAGGPVRVYLETGGRRVFACAADWPGWCRSARVGVGDPDLAVATLEAYAPRYAAVTEEAGVAFTVRGFEVVERLEGNTTTDFGAPAAVARGDAEPLDEDEARRLTGLLEAAWRVFDRVVAATPAELRKGPRGGGRDRDPMVDHVVGAEAAFARRIGIREKAAAAADRDAVLAQRARIAAALSVPSHGSAPVPKGWPHRYALRRLAWHVLDHAWEMQDRTTPT